MAAETYERPNFDPDVVIGPSWDQCPAEWRHQPDSPAVSQATFDRELRGRFLDRVRVSAAMAVNAAAELSLRRAS